MPDLVADMNAEGHVRALLRDADYLQRAADRLMRCLFDLESYRGTGRLYVP